MMTSERLHLIQLVCCHLEAALQIPGYFLSASLLMMQGSHWSREACDALISLVHRLLLNPFFLDVAKENSIKLAGSKKRSNSQKAELFLNQEWNIKLSLFWYIPG